MNVPVTLTGLQTVNADKIYLEGTELSQLYATSADIQPTQ